MIRSEPLKKYAFAAFGEVIDTPQIAARDYFSAKLANNRPEARPSLSMANRPHSPLPLTATVMERHRFSSQTFIATDVSRWIVVVAPQKDANQPDQPDMTRARAFMPSSSQGITIAAGVWHMPLTVLDRTATFVIFMWLDGTAGDEEFFTLAKPLQIDLG